MEIYLKKGIDKAVFGMKQKNITDIYGQPDRQYTDDEDNVIYLYNAHKLRLTFYKDEDMRLGYLITASPNAHIAGKNITGRRWADVQADIKLSGKDFEVENFDTTDNYFNEASWVIFQVEFNEVIRVELGAVINSNDEFEWKFKA